MNQKTYKIHCKQCKGISTVKIDDLDNVYWHETDQVISARKRLDQQWGWQCQCGNNDIMTKQEKRVIADPGKPRPQELQDIIANLKPDEPRFEMEEL